MMNDIIDINWLFQSYYHDNPHLRRIVIDHSKEVAKKAIDIVNKKKLKLDKKDVYCAAMLHDIGVVKCDAKDIYAHGSLPYLRHGLEGKKILENHHLHTYAKVCERHTGAGLTKKEIIENNLPLPPIDMLPISLLEKLICYSDKFFSKSKDLHREKPIDEVMEQMKRYGEEPYLRFLALHRLFG